jgi:hypothetical protein
MRGLLKAALVLAPALASAIINPSEDDAALGSTMLDEPFAGNYCAIYSRNHMANQSIQDRSLAVLGVDIPAGVLSPDQESLPLQFHLEIFPSEETCGYANVSIDGQVLSQELHGDPVDVSTGSGSLTSQGTLVDASWSIHCISANGLAQMQFLKFVINSLDGKPMRDVGFSVLFSQTGSTEILRINTDLSIPDVFAADPTPESVSDDGECPETRLVDDLAELDWMISQLKEFEYLIAEKQQYIAERTSLHFEEDISECDSLKCVVRAVHHKARRAVGSIYKKICGDNDDEDIDGGRPHRKPHRKRPHFRNPFHHGKGKHGNHTCGHKHRNGNHTHPPHWRKPHHPLPICRFPPHHPPPHHPPHRRPPHHDPPHGPPHGRPHGPHHGPPPPGHGRHDRPAGEDVPPPPGFDRDEIDRNGPPPMPHHGGDFRDHHRPGHHPPGVVRVFHVLKFVATGFVLSCFIFAIHRRTCSTKNRADRRARREERRRRRSYNHARRRHGLARFLARISGRPFDDDQCDYEEKRAALLSNAEDGLSATMSEEITQLRNAAGMVEEIVVAEAASQPISFPPRVDSRSMTAHEIGSEVGDGEQLPAYEDNDGSEESSIADGFQYTPGSTEYDPLVSREGSVSDILGPDTKN